MNKLIKKQLLEELERNSKWFRQLLCKDKLFLIFHIFLVEKLMTRSKNRKPAWLASIESLPLESFKNYHTISIMRQQTKSKIFFSDTRASSCYYFGNPRFRDCTNMSTESRRRRSDPTSESRWLFILLRLQQRNVVLDEM